jgi:hypothetical protein
MSWDNTAPTAKALDYSAPLPEDFGEADFFNGGKLYGADLAEYAINASGAISSGVIELTLNKDVVAESSYLAVTSDGQAFYCEPVDLGSAGSPYTATFDSWRPAAGSRALSSYAFSNTPPTARSL